VALEHVAVVRLRCQPVEDRLALRRGKEPARAANADVVFGLQQVAVERRRRAAAGDRQRCGSEEKSG
jgi:hypothetical protein